MVNAHISVQHPASSTALGPGNVQYRGLEYVAKFRPEYLIYVYNVSARDFNIGRINLHVPGVVDDPDVPKRLPTGVRFVTGTKVGRGNISIDGEPEKEVDGNPNERWRFATTFPHPMPIPKPNDQTETIEQIMMDGRRFVIDLIDPDNLTLTLNTRIDENNRGAVGNNYASKGVFFSLSNPPMESDVRAAVDRMEGYYKHLLEKASTLEVSDPAALTRELGGNPDYSYAAKYFGRSVAWNKTPVRTVECPNCGDQKPAGRLFHSWQGTICVEQSQKGWQAAVRAGIKKMDDVPAEFRWKEKEFAQPSV